MEGVEIQTSLESDTGHRDTVVDTWLNALTGFSAWTEFSSETKSRDDKLIGLWVGEK